MFHNKVSPKHTSLCVTINELIRFSLCVAGEVTEIIITLRGSEGHWRNWGGVKVGGDYAKTVFLCEILITKKEVSMTIRKGTKHHQGQSHEHLTQTHRQHTQFCSDSLSWSSHFSLLSPRPRKEKATERTQVGPVWEDEVTLLRYIGWHLHSR